MGVKAIRLESGKGLSATFVPEAGMICISAKLDGVEVLGQRGGLASYIESGKTTGIPILYPWANRLSRDSYGFDGETVTIDAGTFGIRRDGNGLPIHGTLAASSFWQVEETSTGDDLEAAGLKASLDFGTHPELLQSFPFPHLLEVEISLAGTSLTVTTTVTPTADKAVPLASGFHPYISLPGSDRESWAIDLPAMTALETDGRGIPTGEETPFEAMTGTLGDTRWDRAFSGVAEGAVFAVADESHLVKVRFDSGYTAAQVFAPPAENVICFEPMKAPTDALVTGVGLNSVQPGSADVSRFTISVAALEDDPPEQASEPEGESTDPGPAGESGFRLGRNAPASEVKRVARERVQSALHNLRESDPKDRGRAIHETRKDLKKMRAVLRLVRDDLGKKTFREENHLYRDASRLLAEARDADVLEQTIESLRSDYGGDGKRLDDLIQEIRREKQPAGQAAGDGGGGDLANAAAAIESAGSLIESWTLKSDDWALFEQGLRRTYRDGRRGLYRAESSPTAENLHEWRKRVKDLWYQLRLLRNAWSVGLKAQIKETNRLAEMLGEYNDLAMLLEILESRNDDGFTDLAEQARDRQSDLLIDAIPLGHRIYAEDSKDFSTRIGSYWTA